MSEAVEKLSQLGTVFLPRAISRALDLANVTFQQIKASVLPKSLFDFYSVHGGAILGDACIFPVDDEERLGIRRYVMQGIITINRNLSHIQSLRGKTVWGRNQFYWFSASVDGILYMHDVLTLKILRKYDNFESAMTDCLSVGKI